MKVVQTGTHPAVLWVESNSRQIRVDGPTEVPDADASRYIRLRRVKPAPAKKTAAKKTAAKKVSGG